MFKNKAETLAKIRINSALIPRFIYFNASDYKKKKKFFLKKIKKNFNSVAIRSSSFFEDNNKTSAAGKFDSFLNVNPKSMNDVDTSIFNVIKSYKNNHKKNRVIVQEMVKQIKYSGVVTSSDKTDLSPYYVINMSKSLDSSIITSGKNKNNETYFLLKNYKNNLPKKLKIIKKLVDELVSKTKYPHLDIEFAIDKKMKIYLLQVRKIIKKQKKIDLNINEFKSILLNLNKKIIKLQKNNPILHGKTTYFGVMPDWNPAEIIGLKPSPLAFSLYKELISDEVWAEQRARYGYKKVAETELIKSFFGMPYVDLRVDFNSWLPKKLNANLSEKLVNFYLNKFKKKPYLHDKVEFEILFTCFTFSLKKRLTKAKIFNKNEISLIEENLKKITEKSFELINKDKNLLYNLEKNLIKIRNSNSYYINKIYWLLESCKKYGTLPFAGLARSAFIGTEILNSLETQKIISQFQKYNFLNSINTIATELTNDLNNLKKKDFLSKYGHLRPNTYEIDSKNYKQGYKMYFQSKTSAKKSVNNFALDKITEKNINKLILKNKLNTNTKKLFNFIKESITLREYSKFLFTKYIDEIFKNINFLFKRLELPIRDCKYISVQDIRSLYGMITHENLKDNIKKKIKLAKKQEVIHKSIKLPMNIINANDIFLFQLMANQPNFITNKSITGNIYFLKDSLKFTNLKNKIICVENADPGYDFIFSHKILGLVTKFGGANSHMAIRCNELNLPAAIGVGDELFSKIIKSKNIELNSANKSIKPIN